MVNKVIFRFLPLFLVFSVLFIISPDLTYAGTVVIKPGQFDHFTLQVPERLVAGENFIVKISVYDANKNLITNFSETGKEFKIVLSGSAVAQPSVLTPASFAGGVANVVINDKKAEKINFSIYESGATVPVITRELNIIHNKLDHFVLQSINAASAGSIFDVRVIAKDLFDNTVSDLDTGRNIKIITGGSTSVKSVGPATLDFKNGIATASFVSEKAGDVVIEIQETVTGSRGKTQNITINHASLNHFKLYAPANVTAGDPFDLMIAAYDVYENLVTGYNASGSGIALSTTGSSKLEPSFVSPAEFRNGQAIVKASYEKAEEIQIIAKERNRDNTGKTAGIIVSPSAPDHFVVITPDTAFSGQSFRIRIEAYDRFNNLVRNYNLIGNDVMLTTSGTGVISPSRVSPAEFVNGIAVVDVMYDRAESFAITAKMLPDRTTGRVTLKEPEEKKEIPTLKEEPFKKVRKDEVKGAAEEPAKASEKTEKKEIKSTKPGPQPKPKEIKPVVKKEPLKEGKAKMAETAEKKEKKSVEKKKQPDMKEKVVSQEAVKKNESVKQEKKPAEEPKKQPVEVAKKEELPAEKRPVYKISNVSIIEAEKKAMLVINVTSPNGKLDFSDEIESKIGKEWLKLKLKPAINATAKTFKFKSAFVGDVRIEEDTTGKNELNFYIEMLPSGLTYDIARVKNNLIITFATP